MIFLFTYQSKKNHRSEYFQSDSVECLVDIFKSTIATMNRNANLNTKRIFVRKSYLQHSVIHQRLLEKISQLPNLNGEDTEIGLRAALADLIEATRESP